MAIWYNGRSFLPNVGKTQLQSHDKLKRDNKFEREREKPQTQLFRTIMLSPDCVWACNAVVVFATDIYVRMYARVVRQIGVMLEFEATSWILPSVIHPSRNYHLFSQYGEVSPNTQQYCNEQSTHRWSRLVAEYISVVWPTNSSRQTNSDGYVLLFAIFIRRQ